MKKWREEEKEGLRTAWKDSGLEGFRKGGIQERRDTGKEGSGQEGCGTGEMLDRRDAG